MSVEEVYYFSLNKNLQKPEKLLQQYILDHNILISYLGWKTAVALLREYLAIIWQLSELAVDPVQWFSPRRMPFSTELPAVIWQKDCFHLLKTLV